MGYCRKYRQYKLATISFRGGGKSVVGVRCDIVSTGWVIAESIASNTLLALDGLLPKVSPVILGGCKCTKLDINCKLQVSVLCLPIVNHKSVYCAFQCKAGSEAANVRNWTS